MYRLWIWYLPKLAWGSQKVFIHIRTFGSVAKSDIASYYTHMENFRAKSRPLKHTHTRTHTKREKTDAQQYGEIVSYLAGVGFMSFPLERP